MDNSTDLTLILRLLRFCAALYRELPVEGRGLTAQAAELAHAAELDDEAGRLGQGDPPDETALRPDDIRTACQALIDARRVTPAQPREEAELARRHYPEIDAPTLDELERIIGFYTSLLRG